MKSNEEKAPQDCTCNDGHDTCCAECEAPPEVMDAPDPDGALAALQDRYQRSLAEFDNFRKRSIKEKAAMYDEGLRAAAEAMLPIIDNFERALAAQEDAQATDTFYQGIVLVARQLTQALEKLGVSPIPAEPGTNFDPHLHHAVAHTENSDLGPNQIAAILQKGYQHKDKVIRHSMVQVAN